MSRRIKYLGINLSMEIKDISSENYKILMKEIKYDTNRWRDIPCLWIRRITIVRITILPKVIYRFNSIPIKLQMAFFMELEHKISKFVWRHKRPWISNALLRKNGAGVTRILDFRIYNQAIIVKTVWYWHKR